jgi:2-haloacid dehalogenase
MSGSYVDFLSITSDALHYTGKLIGLTLTETQHQLLVNAYYQLPIWPEVPRVLAQLKSSGYRLGFLSNFTFDMLHRNSVTCGIDGYFEHFLSVENIRRYKPDPLTYAMGVEECKLSKKEILFVAFAGWDAAGAGKFGYPTYWVNRMHTPPEQLGIQPDGAGNDLNDLLNFCN